MSRNRRRTLTGAVALIAVSPLPASAGHSYTEIYNPLYAIGVGLVVLVSFALAAMFVGRGARAGRPRRDLLVAAPSVAAAARIVGPLARALAVAVSALFVATGLVGSQIETWNIAPTGLWLLAWIALPALQILVGDVWSAIDPWRTLFAWRSSTRARRTYPEWAGVWPAVVLFAGFLWLRGLWADVGDPRTLAILILAYSAVVWTGMSVFGAHVWLARGECFTVFYTLLAAMGPLERRVPDTARCAGCSLGCRRETGDCVDCAECFARAPRRELNVRMWTAGLIARPAPRLDTTAFVLLMLGGGMFGGILDTRWWERVRVGLGLTAERAWGTDSLALAAFMLLTVAIYALAATLAGAAAGWPALDIARGFAWSLVPLAAGFHLTHGFGHALEGAQLLFRLVSDPFGYGWNLFGTRTRAFERPDPRIVWYVELGVIVSAHVASIWIAHTRAVALFGRGTAALRSQAPMVAVMVLFTVAGLWILTRIPMVM